MKYQRPLAPFVVAAIAGAAVAQAPPRYVAVTIPLLPGHGSVYAQSINDLGEVVGNFDLTPRAFIWLPAAAYGLPAGSSLLSAPLSTQSEAAGINNAGQVAGAIVTNASGRQLVRWNLASSSAAQALYPDGYPQGISPSGTVVGSGISISFGCPVASVFTTPATFAPVGSVVCTNSYARAINASGMVVGEGYTGGQFAFFASPPAYVASPLPNMPGVTATNAYTRAYGINDVGQVAVEATDLALGPIGAIFQDLNGNGIAEPATEYAILSTTSSVRCINNSGIAAGARRASGAGMVFIGGREYDLNGVTKKDASGYPFIRDAVAINSAGQIVCKAFTNSPLTEFSAVVLTPTCYANCDYSQAPPVLNALDFACFINEFAAGSTMANCDGSVAPPVVNVLDFACFIVQFAAGCP